MTLGRTNIVQGEFAVGTDPDAMISTLLGSCVAVCLHDSLRHQGGMNHFLLPGDDADAVAGLSVRHGAYLMELLINGLQKAGSDRRALQAKIFGGARTVAGLSDIGARNIAFIRRFLQNESIPITGESLGGTKGRRLQFWPASGRVRQAFVAAPADENPLLPQYKFGALQGGELELF